jgi:hypothetical protein
LVVFDSMTRLAALVVSVTRTRFLILVV